MLGVADGDAFVLQIKLSDSPASKKALSSILGSTCTRLGREALSPDQSAPPIASPLCSLSLPANHN